MAKQTVKEKRTLVKFAVQRTRHIAGKGAATTWETITVNIGEDESGSPITTDCFYCEWLNSYGQAALRQQADGVIRPARLRMPFVQAVYDALITSDVRIYLYGIQDEAHTFCLAAAADNYLNQNKMIELQVKKYEGK
ncbi:MAG: hypothetical protein NC131_17845 [Roseburia sp.]|nr:hypothetical protein [Roseburia sp.]